MSKDDNGKTVYDYGKNHMNSVRFKSLCSWVLFITLGLLFATWGDNVEKDSVQESGLFLLAMCFICIAGVSVIYYAIRLEQKKRICKALAGLELHVIHCEDDLTILMGIPRDMARDIIMGEYDCLVMDPVYCSYLPTNEMKITVHNKEN